MYGGSGGEALVSAEKISLLWSAVNGIGIVATIEDVMMTLRTCGCWSAEWRRFMVLSTVGWYISFSGSNTGLGTGVPVCITRSTPSRASMNASEARMSGISINDSLLLEM